MSVRNRMEQPCWPSSQARSTKYNSSKFSLPLALSGTFETHSPNTETTKSFVCKISSNQLSKLIFGCILILACRRKQCNEHSRNFHPRLGSQPLSRWMPLFACQENSSSSHPPQPLLSWMENSSLLRNSWKSCFRVFHQRTLLAHDIHFSMICTCRSFGLPALSGWVPGLTAFRLLLAPSRSFRIHS